MIMESTVSTESFVGSLDDSLDDILDDDELGGVGGRLSRGIPARPLLGALPLARVVPQDVHSVVDYAGGLTIAIAGIVADTTAAKVAGMVLGGGLVGASLMTDYRLSLAKVIPIEVHEVLDFVGAVGAIAAPFALGYYKRDRVAALTHIAVGVTELLGSLLTDYRAARGRGRRTSFGT